MNEIEVICNHWTLYKELPPCDINAKTTIAAINKALKHYSLEDILEAISFYAAEVAYLSYSTIDDRFKPYNISKVMTLSKMLAPCTLKDYVKGGGSRDKCNEHLLNMHTLIREPILGSFVMSTEKGIAKVVIGEPEDYNFSREIKIEGLDDSLVIEENTLAKFECLTVYVRFYEEDREKSHTMIPIYHNDNKTNLNECLLAIKGGNDSYEDYLKKNDIYYGASATPISSKYKVVSIGDTVSIDGEIYKRE